MAVLCNNVIAGASIAEDASGDGVYQIEKSLRSSQSDNPQMTRIPVARGNKRKWTVSFWAKRCFSNTHEQVFTANGGGNDICGVRFLSDYVHFYHWDPDTYDFDLRTNTLLRDPSAWYHIVCVYDSSNSVAAERAKIFINGKLASLQTATYPSQYHDSHYMNDKKEHYLLKNASETGMDYHGYLADFQFIDGLALSPAAFGQFASSGTWDPKAFALPAPNDATTWSGQVSGSFNSSSYDATKAFDGNVDGSWSIPADNNNVTWTPSSAITASSSIRLKIAKNGSGGPLKQNGTDLTHLVASGWVELPERTLTTLIWGAGGSGNQCQLMAVEVDGVVLVDGKTDLSESVTNGTALLNYPGNTVPLADSIPGNKTGNSSGITAVESAGTNSFGLGNVAIYDAAGDQIPAQNVPNIFDLPWTIDTYMKLDSLPSAVSYWTGFDSDNGNAVYCIGLASNNKWAFWQTSGDDNIYHDTTAVADTWYHIRVTRNSDDKLNMWVNGTKGGEESCAAVGSGAGDFTIGNWYGGANTGLSGFRGNIGPTRLVAADLGAPPSGGLVTTNGVLPSFPVGLTGNSFHLKFNDTSLNRYLGKDTLNGKIANADGGLPIYNTDATGDVKGSGYRNDSAKANLMLAVPGDTIADVSHVSDLRNSGSAKTLTAQGDAAVSTDQSRLYGSSIKLDGTGDYIQGGSSADYAFGTGQFTIEFWFYNLDTDAENTQKGIIQVSDTAGGLSTSYTNGWFIGTGINASSTHDNALRFRLGDSSNNQIGGNQGTPEEWHHVAVTRDSSNVIRMFIDGVVIDSVTNAYDFTSTNLAIGGYYNTSYLTNGYLQDIRLYKGTAKYTANFTPPTRNDFTVTNLNEIDTTLPQGTNVTITGWNTGTANIHDGDLTTACNGYNGGSPGTVTFSPAIPNVTKVRLYSQPYKHYLNGTDVSSTAGTSSGDPGWYTVYDNSSTAINLTSCGNAYTNGTQSVDLRAIEINGVVQQWGNEPKVDSYTDTPTNFGTDTGAGGEVRGSYATLNPLMKKDSTLRQGNLFGGNTANTDGTAYATIRCPSSGVWYCEATFEEWTAGGNNFGIGVDTAQNRTDLRAFSNTDAKSRLAGFNDANMFKCDGSGGGTNIGSLTLAKGDVWQCCWDVDNGKLYYGKNNTWYTSAGPSSGAAFNASNHFYSETFLQDGGFFYLNGFDATGWMNFGQKPWRYAPPLNAKALCTQNLDDTFDGDEVNNPSKFFDISTYTGTGASQDIKGLGFQPDLVWIKSRSATYDHAAFDANRGVNKRLRPNGNHQEGTDTQTLTAFNSDGYTTGTDDVTNKSGDNYVAWMWDAGTAGAANNDGSINVTNQWVNATAGFSITKYVSNNTAGATVGHGLSTPPHFIIVKNTDSTNNWNVYHKELGNTHGIYLDLTNSADDANVLWNDAGPSNTTFTLGDGNGVNNASSHEYIAYCWAPIAGYSAFGDYDANNSADGPFVYTGFKPRWLMIKRTNGNNNWIMKDTKRYSRNPQESTLLADGNHAETDFDIKIDFLANGFKIRSTDNNTNTSGSHHIYAAFAEHPFKTARAA